MAAASQRSSAYSLSICRAAGVEAFASAGATAAGLDGYGTRLNLRRDRRPSPHPDG